MFRRSFRGVADDILYYMYGVLCTESRLPRPPPTNHVPESEIRLYSFLDDNSAPFFSFSNQTERWILHVAHTIDVSLQSHSEPPAMNPAPALSKCVENTLHAGGVKTRPTSSVRHDEKSPSSRCIEYSASSLISQRGSKSGKVMADSTPHQPVGLRCIPNQLVARLVSSNSRWNSRRRGSWRLLQRGGSLQKTVSVAFEGLCGDT